MVNRGPAVLWTLLIAAIIGVPGAFMYVATSFLFAFSGGQYRMAAIVNAGAIAVVALGAVTTVVGWRIRGAPFATQSAGIATAVGWFAAVVTEWLLSFWLGA